MNIPRRTILLLLLPALGMACSFSSESPRVPVPDDAVIELFEIVPAAIEPHEEHYDAGRNKMLHLATPPVISNDDIASLATIITQTDAGESQEVLIYLTPEGTQKIEAATSKDYVSTMGIRFAILIDDVLVHQMKVSEKLGSKLNISENTGTAESQQKFSALYDRLKDK